jgi:hypothetical protein
LGGEFFNNRTNFQVQARLYYCRSKLRFGCPEFGNCGSFQEVLPSSSVYPRGWLRQPLHLFIASFFLIVFKLPHGGGIWASVVCEPLFLQLVEVDESILDIAARFGNRV